MKNLLACLAVFAAFNVSAQVNGFELPYNPDVEPDGYIGVGDILALLATFGQEFSPASVFLNEDSTAMSIAMGQMTYFECLAACEDLPGSFRLATSADFGRVWDQFETGALSGWHWIDAPNWFQSVGDPEPSNWYVPRIEPHGFPNGTTSTTNVSSTTPVYMLNHCLCATRERPKVEYVTCTSSDNGLFVECCQERVSEGWYPLGSNPVATGQLNIWSQAFWRWAE